MKSFCGLKSRNLVKATAAPLNAGYILTKANCYTATKGTIHSKEGVSAPDGCPLSECDVGWCDNKRFRQLCNLSEFLSVKCKTKRRLRETRRQISLSWRKLISN
jgi:hypothetical protein